MTDRRCVLVCQHQSCLGRGAAAVLQAFAESELDDVDVIPSPCLGQCSSGPTVQIQPDRVWYCRVVPGDVPRLVDAHLKADQPVVELLHPRFHGPLITASMVVAAGIESIDRLG
jgi:(2Fe-2S) ferredoxin